ncbi:MAG: DUF2974 domain-containing protein [Clostridia bacterium]|nr:DUF2974 domain-containing protein [Clostridia bacterium]
MANVDGYLDEYGGVSFCDEPFGEGDNVVLSKLAYMPLELVVSRDLTAEPVPYPEAAQAIYEYYGCKYVPLGLMIGEDVSMMTRRLASTVRFGEMKVVGCIGIDEAHPAVQFGVQTYLLPDGTIAVVYRGTNDSLFGWKEDLDILAKKAIPSHKLAVDYLEAVAKQFDGEIIVCGHSKGGHVALYAALNVSDAVRARIKNVYNNDGPGFWDYRYLYTPAYAELLPKYKHYIPQTSLVGLMLAHDDDYEVIRSDKKLGPSQHDLTSWQFEYDRLERTQLTKLGILTDLVMRSFVEKLRPEELASVEQLVDAVIDATGQSGLLGLSQNAKTSFERAVDVWRATEKPAKALVRSAFRGTGRIVFKAAGSVLRYGAAAIEKVGATAAAVAEAL